MHMFDAISAHQFPIPNRINTIRAQTHLCNNSFICGNDNKGWAFKRWNLFQFPKMDKFNRFGGIESTKHRVSVIRAVATLEPKCSITQSNGRYGNNLELGIDFGNAIVGGFDERDFSGGEDSKEVDEKEKLRCMRISKANKGNTPWNKGRKHSAETLKRIKERTRIAMRRPEVKMKLINLGHAQSQETREKIGVGVRAGWERRRERLKLQETCYFEWQNLIAEAYRRGSKDVRELQWNSYRILDKKLKQEWVESVEQRKKTPRPKGNKRAPKSPEQRRKISEAISAKWADAGYRYRVCSALSKYYGAPVGVGRKPRKQPTGEPKVRTSTKKKVKDTAVKVSSSEKSPSKKRSKMPTYKDMFGSSKLEMIKNIRAQRAASEFKKTEAFKQAKVLIFEAERAAKALEASAMKSPVAQASLLESRELIALAIRSLNSIENGHIDDFNENGVNPLMDVEENANGVSQTNNEKRVNSFGNSNLMGFIGLNSRDEALEGTALDPTCRFSINRLSDDVEEEEESISNTTFGILSPSEFNIGKKEFATNFTGKQLLDQLVRLNGKANSNELLHDGTQVDSFRQKEGIHDSLDSKTATKKWVRGRLVESVEGLD